VLQGKKVVVVLPAYNGHKRTELTNKQVQKAPCINFRRSSIYGLGVLKVSLQYMLNKSGLLKSAYLRN
jgi:hypothetical protein